MKKRALVLTLMSWLWPLKTAQAALPIAEIIKAAIVKAIKAADLFIQRQQSQIIWLQNAQKTLENTMAKLRLDEIAEWLEKNQKLYEDYFKELDEIKQSIATYQRIQTVSRRLQSLQSLYSKRWQLITQDAYFQPQQIRYMDSVYEGILKQSLEAMDRLLLSISPGKARMSDAERLAMINQAAEEIEHHYENLLAFNAQIYHLRLSKARSVTELEGLKRYYGLP